jgi:hypothetical protein
MNFSGLVDQFHFAVLLHRGLKAQAGKGKGRMTTMTVPCGIRGEGLDRGHQPSLQSGLNFVQVLLGILSL